MKLALQVAIGVAAGILIAGAVYEYRTHLAIKAAAAEFDNLVAEQKRQLENARQAQQEQLKARARQQADAAQRRADIVTAQNQLEEARARREWEFNKQYKSAPHCDTPPTWESMVECGNARVRAQREFEKLHPL